MSSCPSSAADTPIESKIIQACTVPTQAIQSRCSPFVIPDIKAKGYLHTYQPRPILATVYALNRFELHAFVRFCEMLEPAVLATNEIKQQIDRDWFRAHYIGVMPDLSIALHDTLSPYVASTGKASSPCFLLDAQTTFMILKGAPYASIISHLTTPA